ncbi:uncharacterized protein LOC123541543 isoform X1 [Mercenaria mercenaria]|uniref:uncharacterized protein LOC123541543 isoform X1 n=1 Tax=Mercenaria mercenaria TaxID=6596 RepID=UPI00234E7F50|nr:uncharacterized protein LOC123541543 isoform X1 [Mercenaria mercenaria]
MIQKKGLQKKETEIIEHLRMTEEEAKGRLDQKGKTIEEDLEVKGKCILHQLDKKQSNKEAANDGPDESERKRADFQERLAKQYGNDVIKVSLVPLKPHRKQENVNDVYIPPWLTVEIKNQYSKQGKDMKISMHEIFRNQEKSAKYVYIIGDAGSGKSMLCKMLVYFWCIAHSHQECSSDDSDIVKEMNNFNFLFYISLRHFADCDSIEKMLEKSYRDPALGDILKNESSECLILLDGLDEWKQVNTHDSQFLTPGLPGRNLHAHYTIVTTSRQWKFDFLQINDSEVDKIIKLHGIDENEIKNVTEKTVKMLNDRFQQSKNAENCTTDIQSRGVSDISHIPLILQQLICLWFDEKLREKSKYAIYSNMLALLFEWNALKRTSKYQEYVIVTQARMNDSPLPDYLCDFRALRENTRVIQYLSQLAYGTLFDENKETSLTFSISALERLNIPNDVIKNCLDIGILAEEQDPSFPASTSQQSLFSFFHKSVQEYLAAVYVASQLKEMLKSRNIFQNVKDGLTDVCETCVMKYLGSCKTVAGVLEQSNVLIMLCGLEPQMLTHVSKFIYDVTLVEKMTLEESDTFPSYNVSPKYLKVIENIQTCLFLCIEEVMSTAKNAQTPVHIAYLSVSPATNLQRYGENVILKNILSIEVYSCWLEYSDETKQTQSEPIKEIRSNTSGESIDHVYTKILDTNVSTLETVNFNFSHLNEIITTRLVSILPKMRRLTSLQMKGTGLVYIPHDVFLSLCTFLNQLTSLRHVALNVFCRKFDYHMIYLSQHEQLQHVDFMFSTICVFSCNTDNLKTCKLSITRDDIMKQVCNVLYKAGRLKYLDLFCYQGPSDEIVTENLIRLLSSLVSLRTLTLWRFTFTDNIIARPRDMKNMKEITFYDVTMSVTTWCKFINSLHALPQAVKVTNIFRLDRSETICLMNRK